MAAPRDPTAFLHEAEAATMRMPGVRLGSIADSCSFAPKERPGRVAALIRELVAQAPGAAVAGR